MNIHDDLLSLAITIETLPSFASIKQTAFNELPKWQEMERQLLYISKQDTRISFLSKNSSYDIFTISRLCKNIIEQLEFLKSTDTLYTTSTLQRLASTLKKKLPLVKNQLAQIEIQPVLNSVLTKQTESILQAINASSTSTEPGFLEQPLQSQIMPQVANTLLSGENSYIHAQKESSGQRVSFFSDTLTNDTASTNAAPNNFVKQYPQVPTSVQHPGLPIENHQSTPPPIDNNAREQQPNEGNARNSTPPLSDTRV